MLACGMDPKKVMAELTGKATGYSKGKGVQCICFQKQTFLWGHGIVAAQVPLGTGIAFANKYKKNGNICFTYLVRSCKSDKFTSLQHGITLETASSI